MYNSEAAELGFACEALKQGFSVYIPYSDKLHYDLLVSYAGTYSRIQIKHVRKPTRHGAYRAKATKSHGKNRNYGKKDCDFIAVLLEADKVWYIIPVENTCTEMLLKPEDGKGKYEVYFEAWDLLKSYEES